MILRECGSLCLLRICERKIALPAERVELPTMTALSPMPEGGRKLRNYRFDFAIVIV